jgi:hypothetical protein
MLLHLKKGEGYICDCCGYVTISDPYRGSHEICDVCGWQDDDLQFDDPNMLGGANSISLNEARENFKKFKKAKPKSHFDVRDPLPDEIP